MTADDSFLDNLSIDYLLILAILSIVPIAMLVVFTACCLCQSLGGSRRGSRRRSRFNSSISSTSRLKHGSKSSNKSTEPSQASPPLPPSQWVIKAPDPNATIKPACLKRSYFKRRLGLLKDKTTTSTHSQSGSKGGGARKSTSSSSSSSSRCHKEKSSKMSTKIKFYEVPLK